MGCYLHFANIREYSGSVVGPVPPLQHKQLSMIVWLLLLCRVVLSV